MTTPADREALLRAIIDEPDCDLPRMAYADACDDLGDVTRGEFIRLQLRVAAMEADPNRPADRMQLAGYLAAMHAEMSLIAAIMSDGRVCECERCLRTQANTLRAIHGDAWEPPHGMSFAYERGFVIHVTADPHRWAEHGPELCRRQPVMSLTVPKRLAYQRRELLYWDGAAYRWGRGAVRMLLDGSPGSSTWLTGLIERRLAMTEHCRKECEMLDYPDQDEALRALGVAALAWAKAYKV